MGAFYFYPNFFEIQTLNVFSQKNEIIKRVKIYKTSKYFQRIVSLILFLLEK